MEFYNWIENIHQGYRYSKSGTQSRALERCQVYLRSRDLAGTLCITCKATDSRLCSIMTIYKIYSDSGPKNQMLRWDKNRVRHFGTDL